MLCGGYELNLPLQLVRCEIQPFNIVIKSIRHKRLKKIIGLGYLKAIPTRDSGALVSTDATTTPLPKVVALTASLPTIADSPAADLVFAAAWAANPR